MVEAVSTDKQILFCIGAQKAGTTWLHEFFAAHPETSVERTKELHYFDTLFVKSCRGFLRMRQKDRKSLIDLLTTLDPKKDALHIAELEGRLDHLDRLIAMNTDRSPTHDAYFQLIAEERADAKWHVDNTPDYALIDDKGFAKIVAACPDARFIFILRDPIDRTWSALKMFRRQKAATASQAGFLRRLYHRLRYPEMAAAISRSQYDQTFAALEKAVAGERILVLFYETLFSEKTIKQICAFLNVAYLAPNLEKRVNAGEIDEIPVELGRVFWKKLSHVYSDVTKRFGSDVPERWKTNEMRFAHVSGKEL